MPDVRKVIRRGSPDHLPRRGGGGGSGDPSRRGPRLRRSRGTPRAGAGDVRATPSRARRETEGSGVPREIRKRTERKPRAGRSARCQLSGLGSAPPLRSSSNARGRIVLHQGAVPNLPSEQQKPLGTSPFDPLIPFDIRSDLGGETSSLRGWTQGASPLSHSLLQWLLPPEKERRRYEDRGPRDTNGSV